MRWDRFFDDLEDQMASEWEAERAALDTEEERLRVARLTLRERLRATLGRTVGLSLVDGHVATGDVAAVGADWVSLHSGVAAVILAPLSAVLSIALPPADLLQSVRPESAVRTDLSERITLGFVLRDLGRRRSAVSLHLVGGRSLHGTVDRAGADHLDLALHEPGAPRRGSQVAGYRIVPLSAIAWLRAEAGMWV